MQERSTQRSLVDRYARHGHPSIQELVEEQGTVLPSDPRELLGDFWPEDESIDDFLALVHESRGHGRPGHAA